MNFSSQCRRWVGLIGLVATWAVTASAQPAAASSTGTNGGGYLFVTFKGERTPLSEQIYFGLSQDGRHWEALHGGEPVLTSELGEHGVRDPYLLRAHDGTNFYLLATDLSTHLHPGWTRATHAGSHSLMIWESTDLVHWAAPRLVPVAAADAGCTWAPEAVYDEAAHDYLVFWASTTASDAFAKQRIWAARTKDFRTFGAPFIYIEKPGNVIDADIVREGGKYYRFAKDETFKAITLESSDQLMGPWQEMTQFSLAKMVGYEGPEGFLLEPAAGGKPAVWGLWLDHYSQGDGYKLFVTHDLAGGQFAPLADFSFPFRFRHGFPLAITAAEYQRLQEAYGPKPAREAPAAPR